MKKSKTHGKIYIYAKKGVDLLKKLLTNCIVVICAFIVGGVMAGYEEKYGILTVAEPSYTAPPMIKHTTENKLNLNTASKEELIALDGIGESLAQRIINYREENGKFYLIEDIMKVSGISESTFIIIKDFIYVE